MIKSGRSEMVESTGRYSGTTVVRNTAEKILKNHGKNNGTGKFDAFVNKMHSMYKATLLDQDQLEDVMEREYKKMYESADPMNESATYSVSGVLGILHLILLILLRLLSIGSRSVVKLRC